MPMTEKKYDPVTAHVPGTDPKAIAEEKIKIAESGDPLPPNPEKKETVLFDKFGIKIVR